MSKKLQALLGLLMVFSLILGACAPAAEPVVEEPQVPVAEEPVAVEEEPVVVEEGPDLDGVYTTMLGNMASYNTIKADALLVELTEDKPPFLLDVRTAEELAEGGYIEGAVHIPLNELAQNIDMLPGFDTPIVAYCGSGWRATIAMTALYGMGWTNVRALKTPFADLAAAGYPIVTGAPEAVALNAAEPDAALVAAADAYLVGIKDHGSKFGITTAEMLNTALVETPELIVLDVRTAAEVEKNGQIDAANYVNIPLEDLIARKAEWPSMDAPIAVTCGSGHRSTMAMTILFNYGYTDVTSLQGGFAAWKEAGYATIGGLPTLVDNYSVMLASMKGYNTVKAADLLVELAEDTPPYLLDVRSAEELAEAGYVEGATNIPLNELTQHLDLLPGFDTPIVAYCGSGWRCTIAMTALHGMGWTNVRALKAAFGDLVTAGYPIVTGTPEPMALNAAQPDASLVAPVEPVLAALKDKGWGGKAADAFNTEIIEKPEMIVIDVRTMEEVTEKGVIALVDQTYLNIPLESFLADKSLWPADKNTEIVIYCGSGHRSTMAMTMLLTNGYTNVTSLKGGFGAWTEAGLPVAAYAAP